jgi:peroxiredoxin Q/BCP
MFLAPFARLAPFGSLLVSLPLLAACGGEAPAKTADDVKPTTAATADLKPEAAKPEAAKPEAAKPEAATGGDKLVGKPAPALDAKAHDGTAVKLSALKGKSVVVYFYPKDETPGCTKEACAFRDAWGDLAKTNVVLVGVSTDTAESHKAFAAHHKLPFHLVSDADGAIAKSFGVPNNGGFLGRQTFVIDKDGNVKKVYREVDVSKHAAEVLADVK